MAAAHTILIVQTAIEADPGIHKGARKRILALLHSGVEEPAAAATTLSEREAAAILGIHPSTLCRWRQGKMTGWPEFPFAVGADLVGRIRYNRREVVDHLQANTLAPAPAEPAAAAS